MFLNYKTRRAHPQKSFCADTRKHIEMYVVSSLAVLVSLGGTLAMAFPLLGGWNEIAVDDVKVVELANWAVGQIGNGYSLLNIQGAEYQVCVSLPGRVAQSVTCLATDACLTADPGVASSFPVRSPYFRGD